MKVTQRLGRRCRVCGERRPTTRTREVGQYTIKVTASRTGKEFTKTATRAMVCDNCAGKPIPDEPRKVYTAI